MLLDTSTGKGLSVEDVARLATWRGLAYGVRIAFRCRNSMHLVAAVLKLANGGGAAVLQNPRDLSEDAVRQLTVCGVVTVVLDEDDSANRDFAIRHGLRVISLSCLLSEDGEETCRSGAAGAAAAECLVIFSSGTTGLPKGVRLSVDNVTSHMRLRLAVRQPLGSVLHVMPMFHIYGLVICFQALMTATPLYFLPPPYSVDRLMDVLEQFKIEEAPLVTPIIRDLAQRSDLHRIAHSVKRIHNGGAALDHETIVRLRSLMPHTQQTQGYGMSETSGGFVYTDTTRPIRDDSIGHVLPETQIRIADDGELFVRGPTVFVGYLPATVDCGVDKEGWLATGDQVKQDSGKKKGGYFSIRDHLGLRWLSVHCRPQKGSFQGQRRAGISDRAGRHDSSAVSRT